MTTFTDEVKAIARQIGEFYLNKFNNDVGKAANEIVELKIIKIEVGEVITITTSKPGRLIGPYGKTIEELISWLKKPIHIVEDHAITDLILWPVYEYDWEQKELNNV